MCSPRHVRSVAGPPQERGTHEQPHSRILAHETRGWKHDEIVLPRPPPIRRSLDFPQRGCPARSPLERPGPRCAGHHSKSPARGGRAIKALLLDQSVLAGVGNIYADEALFEAGISPRQSSRSVSQPALERMAAALRAILAEAISRGGSTLRDYQDADGNSGTATLTHRVYGRGGLPCVRCGRCLAEDEVAQRTTVWCRQCQRGPNKHASTTMTERATF